MKTRRPTVFLVPAAKPCRDTSWQPPMDVYRTKWGWVLRFELAGVRMEDVEVHVMGRQITVSGVRRDVLLEDGCVWYSMEIAYSEFRRTVELPAAIDRGRVQVEGRDGILMVRVITQEEEAR